MRAGEAARTSSPSNRTTPASGSINRKRSRASVDLPQPGLADDADGLARRHLERDAVHRPHPRSRALQHPTAQGKVLAQVERLQQRRGHPRISMASRSPSDSRLKAIDVTKMARPGSAGTIALT